MGGKLYVKTWGCQMNEYDTNKMVELLGKTHGLTVTDNPQDADVLLLNTCSVREKAQEKVFSMLGQWREWKQERPSMVIGVGGCVASQEGSAILNRAPYVDLVFGPQTLHRLPDMIDTARRTRSSVVDISFPEIEKFDCLPESVSGRPSSLVSIMEGCSKYCSFCVVPYTRGEEVSRPFDDVLAECALLAQRGVREIILLGQNVNAYRGAMHSGGAADLAMLLDYIAAIDGIARLRFTTSHPLEFGDRLIQAYATNTKLSNHLHLPVQSGSDRILASMKRGYTALEYKAKIRKLREVRPGISLSSDFIVGYPGETDSDFAASMNLIGSARFDQAYSFIYSARPGTPAAALPDETPMAEKQDRLARLQARILNFGREYTERLVGTVQDILVERPSTKRPQEMAGRTSCNRLVNFPASPDVIGQMVKVRVTQIMPNSLRGELQETEYGTRLDYAV